MSIASLSAHDDGRSGGAEPPPSMVQRMTLILDLFPGRSTHLTLEQVTRRSCLPRSTAHRILDQLVRLEWIQHRPPGYCLGRRALGIGGSAGGNDDIRAAAAPVLHELQVRTGLVVHLAVLDGAQVYYLDKVGGRSAASVPSRVGGRAPAHCTALGKSMLACLPPETVDELLGSQMPRFTDRTVGELGRLHQELNRIRQRHGLAFEQAECAPDISCVAAALDLGEGRLASISLVGGAEAPLDRVAPLVVDAVRRVRTALGVRTTPAPARPAPALAVVPEQAEAPETEDWLTASAHLDWL